MSTHHFATARPDLGSMKKTKQGSSKFKPLPAPTGTPPFRLNIESITGPLSKSKLVFHTVGDTGGVKTPSSQQLVVNKMESQFAYGGKSNPSFFYHLGDVVYFYGEEVSYNDQFFEPYMYYPAPILAIPGNHDGDIDPTNTNPPASLDAFVKVFCNAQPNVLPIAGDSPRTSITQPNVYWTLVTPLANIIGLYTNVPEHGQIKKDQKDWFIGELKHAHRQIKNKALIVALHHPVYSIDRNHGASGTMQAFLDEVFTHTGIFPDLILSAHVHNYQRYTRILGGREIPYIVAGAGGYWHLHNIDSKAHPIYVPNETFFPNVVLEEFCDDRHGFMRITLDFSRGKRKLIGEYFTVPRPQESWSAPAELYDYFALDLKKHKVSNIKGR